MKKLAALFLVFVFACCAGTEYATFQPKFDADVTILNEVAAQAPQYWLLKGIKERVSVNPAYALSETSALELLIVLADYKPVLFHSGPFGWMKGGPFAASRPVAWFEFPSGARINAGLLAWYWTHGFGPEFLKLCLRLDIERMNQMAADGYPAYQQVEKLP